MSIGRSRANDPSTMRGRGWPCLRQFNVFMENRCGRLLDMLRDVETEEVRVVALSVADSIDCAMARLIVSNYDRGKERLKLANFTIAESDVVGVELPEGPQPYAQVCSALLQAELNIHYTYPLLFRRGGRGAIALYVDDVDQALKTLNEKQLRIITEADLLQDDEFL